MALKTLSPATKSAFKSAGVTLSPHAEHFAAELESKGAINWQHVLQIGVEIAVAILGAFGITIPPTPAAKTCAPGCCDHCACCKKALQDALKVVKDISEHYCQCCDENNHCG